MISKTRLLSTCALAAMMVWAAGMQLAQAQVSPGTLWREAVITELDVDFGNTGFHARWRLQRCDCGDLYAQVEQVAPDGVLAGDLLMVSGQVLLAKGFAGQDDDIEPLIQAPSLMLQMVFELLNRSEPEGPAAVNDKQSWDTTEANIDIKLNTGLATGIFPAPWRITGSGWKTDAGQHRFELVFSFSNPQPGGLKTTDSITFSGALNFQKRPFPYVESTDLGGWKIQWLSHDDRESESAPAGLTLKTLRQQIKNQ